MTSAWIRPLVWLRRFRNRCGYGVHSPFAFELITGVFYENTPYYAYQTLREREYREGGGYWRKAERLKVKRLLFRLVNRVQPAMVVQAGIPTAAAIYLQAGCLKQHFQQLVSAEELNLLETRRVDFLYIHHPDDSDFVRTVFDKVADRASSSLVVAVSGIRSTSSMKCLWQDMKQDSRTGITFDLYDLGIIFFDRKRIKQHYVVNF